jgi:hypothetical protein
MLDLPDVQMMRGYWKLHLGFWPHAADPQRGGAMCVPSPLSPYKTPNPSNYRRGTGREEGRTEGGGRGRVPVYVWVTILAVGLDCKRMKVSFPTLAFDPALLDLVAGDDGHADSWGSPVRA